VANEKQPKPGDTILGCVHRPTNGTAHVFVLGGVSYKRSDGVSGTAEWLFMCDRCFLVHAESPLSTPVGYDFVWHKDHEPIEYAEKS